MTGVKATRKISVILVWLIGGESSINNEQLNIKVASVLFVVIHVV